MKRIIQYLLVLACALSLTTSALASAEKPGKGVTVRPGRATWNTGYFQEALVRKGLEELGYKVKRPKDLANPIFYQALVLGDLDYWANGWFPTHNAQLPKDFAEKAESFGYVVKAGGLQGYLVSKKAAEQFNIQSLEDFKRPEVKAAFDQNGDGKADLTACPAGWGCEKTIAHHMETYGLDEHINPIKAAYAASMAQTLATYQSGKPVFFYTWAPNWTIFKLKPAEDVVWINVPEIKPSEAQRDSVNRMVVTDVVGAVSNPVKLGFVVSDIRIVANKTFAQKNPAARAFFEAFTLPLVDINEQNTRMQQGEDSKKDIERHVAEWIDTNKGKWNGWLDAARKTAL